MKEIAGNMLTKKSPEWMPIQTYQNGLLASMNETKVIMEDDADQELEGKLLMIFKIQFSFRLLIF